VLHLSTARIRNELAEVRTHEVVKRMTVLLCSYELPPERTRNSNAHFARCDLVVSSRVLQLRRGGESKDANSLSLTARVVTTRKL
jgi:hypothetical protein